MNSVAMPRALLLAAFTATMGFIVPASAQELRFNFNPDQFRFEREDRRANEGKRASCSLYAQIAVVQAEANRRFNCGYNGGAWDADARPHFRWCRFASREAVRRATRGRSEDLQNCFDRMGDFDDDRGGDQRNDGRGDGRFEDRGR